MLTHLLEGLFLGFLLQAYDVCKRLLRWFDGEHIERAALPTRRGIWHKRHNFAPAGTGRGKNPGMAKIVRNGLFRFFAALANNPQHHEQGHHCRNEIGVCYFPRAAVVATVSLLYYLLNNRY